MAECWFRPHWFPIAACVLMPLTFLVTYLIAVFLGHVEADFPYISDTGTKPPESCIFGQFLNIGAVLVGITFYIRYKQVQEYSGEDTGGRSMCYINRAALSIGMLSALGISMVANFQETSVLVVHLAGAVLAFGLGTVYMILNTVLSYRLAVTPRWMCHLRAVLSFIAGLMFFCMFLFAGLAGFTSHAPGEKWKPDENLTMTDDQVDQLIMRIFMKETTESECWCHISLRNSSTDMKCSDGQPSLKRQ